MGRIALTIVVGLGAAACSEDKADGGTDTDPLGTPSSTDSSTSTGPGASSPGTGPEGTDGPGATGGNTGGATGGNTGGNTGATGGDTAGPGPDPAGAGGSTGEGAGGSTGEGAGGGPMGAGGAGGSTGEGAGGSTGEGAGGGGPMGAGGTPTVEEPEGPPENAYVPCSGEPLPGLQLVTVLDGLDSPTHAVTPEGDAQTMFVTERTGALLRFDLSEGDPAPATLLDLNTSSGSECGFFGVALHPNFDGVSENRIYVSYMPTCPPMIFGSGGSSALDEYIVEGDTATFSQSLLELDQPEGNHNGGGVAFGPDGYLYLGLGDGGGSNDAHGQNGNGQDPNTPLGSILRFDVDAIDTPPDGNLTSADVGGASVDSRVFHYGLRNPWRFSFDRVTGDLYIGDVGQNTWEEVSFAPADSGPLNFGWAAREGMVACPSCSNKSLLSGTTAVDPIHVHARGQSGSGTGGFVYRGNDIPGLYGRYIYGDYATGDMWIFTYDGEGGICDEVENPIPGADLPNNSLVSFAEDADGELYVINMSRGTISRIEAAE